MEQVNILSYLHTKLKINVADYTRSLNFWHVLSWASLQVEGKSRQQQEQLKGCDKKILFALIEKNWKIKQAKQKFTGTQKYWRCLFITSDFEIRATVVVEKHAPLHKRRNGRHALFDEMHNQLKEYIMNGCFIFKCALQIVRMWICNRQRS